MSSNLGGGQRGIELARQPELMAVIILKARRERLELGRKVEMVTMMLNIAAAIFSFDVGPCDA